MNLLKEINSKRKEIRTDGYSMSVGEWISLYEDDEIDIHPEFQRFYRWSAGQKTNLIESILLGIPIPPVFVSQREDGKWDVIDGLQRLSTIYELVGILKDEDRKPLKELTLEAATYLPGLKGYSWSGKAPGTKELPSEAKLIIKRAKLQVSIVEKESDTNAKYDLFQRLNTGGSSLTAQEVRNCILVMINKDFYRWLQTLADNENFKSTIIISDRQREESYDLELVLRFIAFSASDDTPKIGDVGVHLDTVARDMAKNDTFPFDAMQELFEETFKIIYEAAEDNAFKRYDIERNKFVGGFSLTAFETVTAGIAYNLKKDSLAPNIQRCIQRVWKEEGFKTWTRAGTTAARRLPQLIPLGRRIFKK